TGGSFSLVYIPMEGACMWIIAVQPTSFRSDPKVAAVVFRHHTDQVAANAIVCIAIVLEDIECKRVFVFHVYPANICSYPYRSVVIFINVLDRVVIDTLAVIRIVAIELKTVGKGMVDI